MGKHKGRGKGRPVDLAALGVDDTGRLREVLESRVGGGADDLAQVTGKNAHVLEEARWIVRGALEGLPCPLHPEGRKIDIDTGASIKRWTEFLGPDCKRVHVPQAMSILVGMGVMRETVEGPDGPLYKAAVDFKTMNSVLRAIDPAYGPALDRFVADTRRQLAAIGIQ